MNKKELKKLMTRVAKGEVSEKEAKKIMKEKKKEETNTRKRSIKTREVK